MELGNGGLKVVKASNLFLFLSLSSSDCCLCLLSTIRMSVIKTKQWLNTQMVHLSKIVLTPLALNGHLDSDWSELIT